MIHSPYRTLGGICADGCKGGYGWTVCTLSVLLVLAAYATPQEPFSEETRDERATPAFEAMVGCRNEVGRAVDWWIILKLPDGEQHVFVDSDRINASSESSFKWSSGTSLSNSENHLGATLSQLYRSNSSNVTGHTPGHLMYNDETPSGREQAYRGHSKGVFGFGASQGFFLLHSAPGYPLSPFFSPSLPPFPFPHQIMGQSFLCVTLAALELDAVALLMRTAFPYVYSYSVPGRYAKHMPNMRVLAHATRAEVRPQLRRVTLSSAGGEPLVGFAKSRNLPLYLYEGLVEPYFRSAMLFETFRKGIGALPSFCTRQLSAYPAMNVQRLRVASIPFAWNATQDHSKWGITWTSRNMTSSLESLWAENASSASSMPPARVVCVGDMNRAEPQLHRGGAALCFRNNTSLWTAFAAIIQDVEECP